MREPRIWPYPVIFAGTVLAMIGFMVRVFDGTHDAASHSDGCLHRTSRWQRVALECGPAGSGLSNEHQGTRRAGTRASPEIQSGSIVRLAGGCRGREDRAADDAAAGVHHDVRLRG